MGKTISEWEENLERKIHDCINEGTPMDLFCTECLEVQTILRNNKNFSKEEVTEFFSLEPSNGLREKIARVFGKSSIITQSFDRVTSGVFPYTKIIKRDFGSDVLARLEFNLQEESGSKVTVG